MSKYQLTTGIQKKALRVGIYGQPGIGKTTLAAEFPNPVFIDVEDGSNQLPVARLPRPTSWAMLMDECKEVRDGNVPCSTLVVDTADAAEMLCIQSLCAEHGWDGLEGAGYGKGYTYAAERFGKFLDLLGEVVDSGRNIVLTSHAMARKFERPDETGAYDRYEPKLSKKVTPMYKEWCDMLLFLDYKIYVETESNKDGKVTKAKAKGGRRVMRTTHHPCWDAKNRFGLAEELPLEYASISKYVPDMMLLGGRTTELKPVAAPKPAPAPVPTPKPAPAPKAEPLTSSAVMREVDERLASMQADVAKAAKTSAAASDPRDQYPPRCKALVDLMRADNISDQQLRAACAAKGFVTQNTPVSNYPEDLINGICASWTGFMKFVKANS